MRICKRNSVTVRVGDRVKKGAVLGKSGNSGNNLRAASPLPRSWLPGPSVLGSDGVPYVIDTFNLAGQIDIAAFQAAPDLDMGTGESDG